MKKLFVKFIQWFRNLFKSFIRIFKRPLKHVVICGDVSGSSSHINMIDKINQILFDYVAKKTTMVLFDNQVNLTSEINKGQKFPEQNYKGGAGTDFQAPIDWIEQNLHNDVSLCIIVTDGYATFPKKSTLSDKTVWMIFDNPTFIAPFGKVVFI